MIDIKAAIVAYFMAHGAPGNSPYSYEPLPQCGKDPEHAACAVKPFCDTKGDPRCAAPKWSKQRNAWVRVETPDHAKARWEKIAAALERNASYLVTCKLPDGTVDEDCELSGWPRGKDQERSLAFSGASVVFWESGGREDIQFGYAPAGRGPDGESCAMQIMPQHIASYATWLSKRERQRVRTPAEVEQLAQSLLGDSDEALDHCISVGMRMLARARQSCRGKGFAWSYGMFSMYGLGSGCSSQGISGDFAAKREKTLNALLAMKEKNASEPESIAEAASKRR